MSANYQNIVIGGGHNGLVCAAYLAKAGQSVVVLEAAAEIGGAARTRELEPGVQVPSGAHLLHAMPAQLITDLQLEKNGLSFAVKNLKTLSLDPAGQTIVLDGSSISGANLSASDIDTWPRFQQDMQRFAQLMVSVYDQLPPELSIETWKQRLGLLGLGWRIRRLGRFHMRELLRIIGMNIYDLLDEYFESPQLKAAIAMDAVLGAEWGPRSMGTVLTYLYRQAGHERSGGMGLAQPSGGMGALTQAIAKSAQAAGAEIRTNMRVKRVLIENDRAVGVELESGEQLRAANVISNADPKNTFMELVSTEHLDTGFVRQIRNLRSSGRAAKLHLALSGAPKFNGVDAHDLGARLLIAPCMDDIELAFNPCKYGRYPLEPVMEITLPSVSDPSLAGDGKHVLSAIVQYLPYDDSPEEDVNRAACLESVLNLLERYAPGIRELVSHAELVTPHDLEREFGMSGGHWHHVELVFEAFLFNRPVPALAQHASPIAGLYLCGAGCHPGGNVMGIAGRNAARQVLKQAAGGAN